MICRPMPMHELVELISDAYGTDFTSIMLTQVGAYIYVTASSHKNYFNIWMRCCNIIAELGMIY